jgi:hypothetical protein
VSSFNFFLCEPENQTKISAAEQSVMWWIGDWWAYGDKQGYGERSKVLEALVAGGHNPPAYKTCRNAGVISSRLLKKLFCGAVGM